MLLDLLDVFGGYDVWLVGFHVSDEESDSTDVPIPALAAELHEKLQACPRPTAFERPRKRLLT